MTKRKLEELNLLDDFLFGSMVTYPEIGEEFSRELLKIIIKRNFGKLKIVPQKIFYGSDTDLHGARLDVCIEEDEAAMEFSDVDAVYDFEPEKKDDDKYIKALPRRVRFYHAVIDTRNLRSGQAYDKLKNVYIIMIVPFDPFGLNRMVYTIKNKCDEVPDMPYEDGAKTIFLYTKGTEGNPPEDLRQLLQYMEHSTKDNAKNETLEKIHQMVEHVKKDKEVSLQFMKSWERDAMIREEGREDGRKEERANTERERRRAEEAEMRADLEMERARLEIQRLKEELETLKQSFEKRS